MKCQVLSVELREAMWPNKDTALGLKLVLQFTLEGSREHKSIPILSSLGRVQYNRVSPDENMIAYVEIATGLTTQISKEPKQIPAK